MATPLPTNAIGANIKAARENKRWSQGDLATSLKVSVQAISQWENGKTLPSIDNIMAAASLLEVHPGYILWGNAFEVAGFPRDDTRRVPIILWESVPTLTGSENWMDAIKGKVSGYLTSTEKFFPIDFALEVRDLSMHPEFRIGDHVLVEMPMGPDPGSIVLAVVFEEDRPVPILRKLQIRQEKNRKVYRLVPLNPDYPTIDLKSDRDGHLVGTVVEQRRYFQTEKDVFGFDVREEEYRDSLRRAGELK